MTFIITTYHSEASATDALEEIVSAALAAPDAMPASTPGEPPSRGEGFRACCDMCHLKNQGGIPTIILRPGSLKQAHKTDEYVEMRQLLRAAELYERIAVDWLSRREEAGDLR